MNANRFLATSRDLTHLGPISASGRNKKAAEACQEARYSRIMRTTIQCFLPIHLPDSRLYV